MPGSKSVDFISKGKAIGLPFSQKIAGSKIIDFISKGKAIGLPFSPKYSCNRGQKVTGQLLKRK